MNKKIFRSINEEQINAIKKLLHGLDKVEWEYIKNSIDMYFSTKAAKLKIDDLNELDTFLKRKY